MHVFKAVMAAATAVFAIGWEVCASPRIGQDITMVRKQEASCAVVSYTVADEPAVITIDVLTNGVSAGPTARLCVTGDVNRLVQPGAHKAVLRMTDLFAGVSDDDVSVTVRAWATNCPPDYLVISLTNKNEAARYYLTAEDVPDGVSHARYKGSHLVMRKIPAANVEWRMGSPALEVGHDAYENAHYVRLTEDFYIGIYPVTYRQHINVVGSFGYGIWKSDSPYAAYRADDLPLVPAQFVSLRSWMHDNSNGCNGDCGVHIKCWPGDGHDIDAAGANKCVKSGGTYTPYLRSWRNNTGFEFDLPTDAQWEFACRAGTGGRTYASDATRTREGEMPSNIGDIAWHVGNSSNSTYNCAVPQRVGQKQPNGYGLYDMIGNVWEWCLDHYAQISGTAEESAVDPDGGNFVNNRAANRVVRGGSCSSPSNFCRSAKRSSANVAFVDGAYGSAVDKVFPWTVGYRLWLPSHAAR